MKVRDVGRRWVDISEGVGAEKARGWMKGRRDNQLGLGSYSLAYGAYFISLTTAGDSACEVLTRSLGQLRFPIRKIYMTTNIRLSSRRCCVFDQQLPSQT